MLNQLEYFIRLHLKNPIDEEINAVLNIFSLREYKKDEYFKFHDRVCKNIGFIVDGSFRHYVIKDNGEEITGRVTQKNNFVSDIISLRTNSITPIFIKAMEPTQALVASSKDIEEMLETNLTLNRLLREYTADNVVEMGKMRILFLTGTARDRYKFLIENNPSFLKNIPLRFIASIIGITPTQLSRIRNKKEK